MSGQLYSQSVPAHVSIRRAVARDERITACVEGHTLARVARAVRRVGNFAVDLQFGRNENDKRCVHLTMTGEVFAECQRCLDEVAVPINVDTEVVFVAHDDEARSLLKSVEPWVVTDDKLDTYALLEEEVLLALPTVAMHAEPCVVDGYTADNAIDEQSLSESSSSAGEVAENLEDKQNPFAALASLQSK